MFPKFLFPVNNIIFNSSIFLTIVIAYERYYEANTSVFDSFVFRFSCVCRPHQYRHSTLGTSISRRVASYVVPTVVFSTVLNIPKFLETQLVSILNWGLILQHFICNFLSEI